MKAIFERLYKAEAYGWGWREVDGDRFQFFHAFPDRVSTVPASAGWRALCEAEGLAPEVFAAEASLDELLMLLTDENGNVDPYSAGNIAGIDSGGRLQLKGSAIATLQRIIIGDAK